MRDHLRMYSAVCVRGHLLVKYAVCARGLNALSNSNNSLRKAAFNIKNRIFLGIGIVNRKTPAAGLSQDLPF